MILYAYSVVKKKQGFFNPPFFVRGDVDAVDLFNTYFEKNKDHDKNKYALYRVGSFDDETGILTPMEIKEIPFDFFDED